jgi:ureidoacrylate peracid hydrolase
LSAAASIIPAGYKDLKPKLVSDCNAADNDEEHNASLRAIYLTFGDVMDSAMVGSSLQRRSNKRAAE